MQKHHVRKYRIAFKFITVLNLILISFLLDNISGQIPNNIPLNQAVLVARVTPQNDSPLQISIIRVDNSDRVFQYIVYSVQNVGNKPIRAYALVGGKVITNSFAGKLLFPGEVYTDAIPIERKAIKEGKEVFLFIDFVEFGDGSFWGRNTQGKSREIAGQRAGRNSAIRQLKDFIRSGDIAALGNLLNQNLAQISIQPPSTNLGREWEKGFQRGFKNIIAILQQIQSEGIEAISRKLESLEEVNKEK